MESGKVTAEDQHWPFLIEGWESGLDPRAHGDLVNVVQVGNFFHGVVAVCFGAIGVMQAFFHDELSRVSYAPRLARA